VADDVREGAPDGQCERGQLQQQPVSELQPQPDVLCFVARATLQGELLVSDAFVVEKSV
jgi:hypothetical protein